MGTRCPGNPLGLSAAAAAFAAGACVQCAVGCVAAYCMFHATSANPGQACEEGMRVPRSGQWREPELGHLCIMRKLTHVTPRQREGQAIEHLVRQPMLGLERARTPRCNQMTRFLRWCDTLKCLGKMNCYLYERFRGIHSAYKARRDMFRASTALHGTVLTTVRRAQLPGLLLFLGFPQLFLLVSPPAFFLFPHLPAGMTPDDAIPRECLRLLLGFVLTGGRLRSLRTNALLPWRCTRCTCGVG